MKKYEEIENKNLDVLYNKGENGVKSLLLTNNLINCQE